MRDPCSLHEPEAALALRAALAPSYTSLRRVLAQLCGLMLLSGGRRAETRDGVAVSLAALKLDIAEAADALRRASEPGRDASVRGRALLAAAADVEAARAGLERSLGALAPSPAKADDALTLLHRAQRRMLAVSDDRAGMAMVGFSHACCRAAPALACR